MKNSKNDEKSARSTRKGYFKMLFVILMVMAVGIGSYFLAGTKFFKGQLSTEEQSANTEMGKVVDKVELEAGYLGEEFKTWPLESGKETAFGVKQNEAPADDKPALFWSKKGVGNWRALKADFDVTVKEATEVEADTATKLIITAKSLAWGTEITQNCLTFKYLGTPALTSEKLEKLNTTFNCVKVDSKDTEPEKYIIDFTGYPPGEYIASLMVYDKDFRFDHSEAKNFTITAPDVYTVTANCSASPPVPAAGEGSETKMVVALTDSSKVSVNGGAATDLNPTEWNWEWNFGDENTDPNDTSDGTTASPEHIYARAKLEQNLTVSFTVTKNDSDPANPAIPAIKGSGSCPVTIPALDDPVIITECTAVMSNGPDIYSKTVTFTDKSTIKEPGEEIADIPTGSDWTWSWNLGDGKTSSDKNPPKQTYSLKNDKQDLAATLTLENSEITFTETVDCNVVTIPDIKIKAACFSEPDEANQTDAQYSAIFEDDSNVLIDGKDEGKPSTAENLWTWQWNFGDTSNLDDVQSHDQQSAHTYPKSADPQTKTATLIVTKSSDSEITDFAQCLVDIPALGAPDVTASCTGIVEDGPDIYSKNVSFNDNSTITIDGTTSALSVDDWDWSYEFKDGTNFTGEDKPVLVYNLQPELQTISPKLTITNKLNPKFIYSSSCSVELKALKISPACSVSAPVINGTKATVTFTDLSKVFIDGTEVPAPEPTEKFWEWSWDFKNGNTSTLKNPDVHEEYSLDVLEQTKNISVTVKKKNSNPPITETAYCPATLPPQPLLAPQFEYVLTQLANEAKFTFYNKSTILNSTLEKVVWLFTLGNPVQYGSGVGMDLILENTDLPKDGVTDGIPGDIPRKFPYPLGNGGSYGPVTEPVKLSIFDNFGNSKNITQSVEIYKPLKAGYDCSITGSNPDKLFVKVKDNSKNPQGNVPIDKSIISSITISFSQNLSQKIFEYKSEVGLKVPLAVDQLEGAKSLEIDFTSQPKIDYKITNSSGTSDQVSINVLADCNIPTVNLLPFFSCVNNETIPPYSLEIFDNSTSDNSSFNVEKVSLKTNDGTILFSDILVSELEINKKVGNFSYPGSSSSIFIYEGANKLIGTKSIEKKLWEWCPSIPKPFSHASAPRGIAGADFTGKLFSSVLGANILGGSGKLIAQAGTEPEPAAGGEGGAAAEPDFDYMLGLPGATVYFEANECSQSLKSVHIAAVNDALPTEPAEPAEAAEAALKTFLLAQIGTASLPAADSTRADLDINKGAEYESKCKEPDVTPLPITGTIPMTCTVEEKTDSPNEYDVKISSTPTDIPTVSGGKISHQYTLNQTAGPSISGMPNKENTVVSTADELPVDIVLKIEQSTGGTSSGSSAATTPNTWTGTVTCEKPIKPTPPPPSPQLSLSCTVTQKSDNPEKYEVKVIPTLQDFPDTKSYKHKWTVAETDEDEVVDLPTTALILPEASAGDPAFTVGLKITEFEGGSGGPDYTPPPPWSINAPPTTCVIPPKSGTPTISFTANPYSGNAPLYVQFTDHSQPLANKPLTGTWNFGDGPAGTAGSAILAYNPNNDGSNKNPTHAYQNIGTYTVKLSLTDGTNSGEHSATITVTNPPSNPPPKPQCSDNYDNDGDGLIDYTHDPGCNGPDDNDEYNAQTVATTSITNNYYTTTTYTPPPTICSDGLDNDKDGFVDLKDPGCDSYADNDENNYEETVSVGEVKLPECLERVNQMNFTDIEGITHKNIVLDESGTAYDGEDDDFVGQRIFEGYPEDGKRVFRPFSAIRRDEAVKTALITTCYMDHIIRTDRLSKDIVKYKDLAFDDDQYWAADLIYVGAHAGILEKKNKFYPENQVTRAEFLKLLLKIYSDVNNVKIPDCNKSKIKFVDVDEEDWFCKYAIMGKEIGISRGFKDDDGKLRLNPNKILTRTDAAIMLWNYYIATTGEDFDGDDDAVKVVPR